MESHITFDITPSVFDLNQILSSLLGCFLIIFLTPIEVMNCIASHKVSCPLIGIVSKHLVISATYMS